MPAKKKKTAAKKRAKTARRRATAPAAARSGVKRARGVVTIPTPMGGTEPAGAATILYIHGIGNKPIASVLKRQWDQALFEFDLGERSRMAYWVDRDRYPVPLEADASGGDFADETDDQIVREFTPKAAREAWVPAIEKEKMDGYIAEVMEATETPNEAVSPEAAGRRLHGLAAKMLGDTPLTDDAQYQSKLDALRGPAGEPVRRIQAQRYGAAAVQAKVFGFLPKPVRQWLTRNVTKAFLRDVNDLFVDKDKGGAMKNALRERLRAEGGPFVVISHSQGTMIAYTVLMEPEFANHDIRLFVTLGSPLGIAEVQDFLKDHTGQTKLAVPPNVKRWINVCDPLDPVALDKTIKGDFRKNARGVEVKDELEFNPDSPRHPHSGTGYLSLASVRQPVREAVDTALFQPVARFKIAKDVVRALTDSGPDDRHRVLVQLEDFATTEMNRKDALARIYEILQATEDSATRESLAPEELHRYVALNLTRQQAEMLSAQSMSDRKSPVARIWKNSAKWAMLDRSIHTTQAFPAHNSYKAAGADVTWAVLDSGIHLDHPHFSNKTILRAYDCTDPKQRRNGDRMLEPLDLKSDAGRKAAADNFGHGAHVAGIIAGTWTSKDADGKDRVMCGMAPEAKLVIYKVLDDNGSGEDSWIIKALDDIFETNENAGRVVIHGVNLSLGGAFDVEAFNCGHTPLCVELRRLWRQGVAVVLAAGNEGFATLSTSDGDSLQANMGMSLGDPANLDDAIVVGSVHKEAPHTYGTSFFSSRGPTADGRMKPDCVAPGERIFSVRSDAKIRANGPPATFEQLYTEMSGTSMAAPHVSGLIAAFLSKRKEFLGRPDDVKKILLANCTDLNRQRNMQGAGMPNLVKMLVNV